MRLPLVFALFIGVQITLVTGGGGCEGGNCSLRESQKIRKKDQDKKAAHGMWCRIKCLVAIGAMKKHKFATLDDKGVTPTDEQPPTAVEKVNWKGIDIDTASFLELTHVKAKILDLVWPQVSSVIMHDAGEKESRESISVMEPIWIARMNRVPADYHGDQGFTATAEHIVYHLVANLVEKYFLIHIKTQPDKEGIFKIYILVGTLHGCEDAVKGWDWSDWKALDENGCSASSGSLPQKIDKVKGVITINCVTSSAQVNSDGRPILKDGILVLDENGNQYTKGGS